MGRVTVAANFLYGLSLVLKDEVNKMKAQKAIAAFYKKTRTTKSGLNLGRVVLAKCWIRTRRNTWTKLDLKRIKSIHITHFRNLQSVVIPYVKKSQEHIKTSK